MKFPYRFVPTAPLLSVIAFASALRVDASEPSTDPKPEMAAETPVEMRLDDCIAAAMQRNHERPASLLAVSVAEAQHQQALSAYWPHATLKAAYEHMDTTPDFLFPATTTGVPPQTITLPAGTALITIPAGVLGPTAVQLPVTTPQQTIKTPGEQFPVPSQDVKLMNPDSVVASIDASWLLFDGGMRRGYDQQARGMVDMMKAEAHRTDLQVVDAVKRYYYGAILAGQVQRLGSDTLARMEATLSLTETMYKEGSGKVQKTDYLDNKLMVESLRAMVAELDKNAAMSQAALANSIGMPWNASVRPAEHELPLATFSGNLEALVGTAYSFNPDWNKVEAALRSLDGAVVTARSGHAPKVALTGEIHRWWNSYQAGIATSNDKEFATVGLGMELPLFDGFLTRQKVAEARARLARAKEEQFLLREGIGLQIKDVFLGLVAAQKAEGATREAMSASQENRELYTRAYQNELVETEKLIRSQLIEALMTAQHFKARYDLLALRSQLDLLVGTEVIGAISGK